MDSDIFYLIISVIYIGVLAILGLFEYRILKWNSEAVRKFIHIFTSNLIFIIMYKINSPYAMLLGPFLFIFANAVFVYSGYGRLIGMGDRKRDNGLIYYPLSVFVLILLNILGFLGKESVVSGVLIMGWGDGLAAVVGTFFGRHRYKVFERYKKSIEGTLAMFAVSFVVILIFSSCPWYFALVIALGAALLENITPFGFDNITVPIVSSVLIEVLCRI